jgi:hypothetical protein
MAMPSGDVELQPRDRFNHRHSLPLDPTAPEGTDIACTLDARHRFDRRLAESAPVRTTCAESLRSRRVFTLPSIRPSAAAASSPLMSLEEALNVVEVALLDVPAGFEQIAENRGAHTTTSAQVGQILHAR